MVVYKRFFSLRTASHQTKHPNQHKSAFAKLKTPVYFNEGSIISWHICSTNTGGK